MMDVAVPANMKSGPGAAGDRAPRLGGARGAGDRRWSDSRDVALIDLRERASAKSTASSPARCTRPIRDLQENIGAGGMLHELASATDKRLVFYCAFGERSAMAVQAAQDAGLATACHIHGGIDAWKRAQGPIAQ